MVASFGSERTRATFSILRIDRMGPDVRARHLRVCPQAARKKQRRTLPMNDPPPPSRFCAFALLRFCLAEPPRRRGIRFLLGFSSCSGLPVLEESANESGRERQFTQNL